MQAIYAGTLVLQSLHSETFTSGGQRRLFSLDAIALESGR